MVVGRAIIVVVLSGLAACGGADEENADPITVTLQSEDGAQQIAGVEPGATCGVDLELAGGDYVVTSDVTDGDAEFTVVEE